VKLVDLNVLLYAVNLEATQHERVRTWWETTLAGSEPVGLAWVVLLGFLRISTNPRVFPKPLTAEQALERIEAWLAHPNTRVVTEQANHWQILSQLLRDAGTLGNLTTDAHLASLAIANGATLASCDSDFLRFPQLRCENPAAER
jgi:toxin-antitoxin system PIN domain toxin